MSDEVLGQSRGRSFVFNRLVIGPVSVILASLFVGAAFGFYARPALAFVAGDKGLFVRFVVVLGTCALSYALLTRCGPRLSSLRVATNLRGKELLEDVIACYAMVGAVYGFGLAFGPLTNLQEWAGVSFSPLQAFVLWTLTLIVVSIACAKLVFDLFPRYEEAARARGIDP